MEQEDNSAGSLASLSRGEFASRLLPVAFGIAAMAFVAHMGLERYENEKEAEWHAELERRVRAQEQINAKHLMELLHPGWDVKP